MSNNTHQHHNIPLPRYDAHVCISHICIYVCENVGSATIVTHIVNTATDTHITNTYTTPLWGSCRGSLSQHRGPRHTTQAQIPTPRMSTLATQINKKTKNILFANQITREMLLNNWTIMSLAF